MDIVFRRKESHMQHKDNRVLESVKILVNNLLLGTNQFFKEEQKIIRFILFFCFFLEIQNAQGSHVQKNIYIWKRKRVVFKVGAGNMFTKAQPNSLWQGTEEKVTACAAAKFRRFKKVLLYLQWMWLMSGRPRESGWLIRCYFQWRGNQGFFFFFVLFEIHFLVKLGKMHFFLEGGGGNFNLLWWGRQYTNVHRGHGAR